MIYKVVLDDAYFSPTLIMITFYYIDDDDDDDDRISRFSSIQFHFVYLWFVSFFCPWRAGECLNRNALSMVIGDTA